MTTITYRDGIMAADSRCTDDYYKILTDCQKIFRLSSGAVLGTAGDDDARELMVMLDEVTVGALLPTREELATTEISFVGLLALPDGTLWQIDIERQEYDHEGEWRGSICQLKTDFAAVGSGGEIAIGAMTAGATAINAIFCAVTKDIFSGLPVQYLKVGSKRKEPIIRKGK